VLGLGAAVEAAADAGGLFNDDDVGAHVGEEHGAEGAGGESGEVEDADSFEGLHMGSLAGRWKTEDGR